MIVEFALNIAMFVFNALFNLASILPALPDKVEQVIEDGINLIMHGYPLVQIFLDMEYIKILLPVVLGVVEFSRIADIVKWIIRKIPFLNIR